MFTELLIHWGSPRGFESHPRRQDNLLLGFSDDRWPLIYTTIVVHMFIQCNHNFCFFFTYNNYHSNDGINSGFEHYSLGIGKSKNNSFIVARTDAEAKSLHN